MDPELLINMNDELEPTTLPSLTYRVEGGRITNMIDGSTAMVQAVNKLLNTELWDYEIYGDDYGVEFNRLIGESYDFVSSDLERTIVSALEVDDRFVSVENFEIKKTGIDRLYATFDVVTTEGTFYLTREVDL